MSTVLLPCGWGLDQRQRSGKVRPNDCGNGSKRTKEISNVRAHLPFDRRGVPLTFMGPLAGGLSYRIRVEEAPVDFSVATGSGTSRANAQPPGPLRVNLRVAPRWPASC